MNTEHNYFNRSYYSNEDQENGMVINESFNGLNNFATSSRHSSMQQEYGNSVDNWSLQSGRSSVSARLDIDPNLRRIPSFLNPSLMANDVELDEGEISDDSEFRSNETIAPRVPILGGLHQQVQQNQTPQTMPALLSPGQAQNGIGLRNIVPTIFNRMFNRQPVNEVETLRAQEAERDRVIIQNQRRTLDRLNELERVRVAEQLRLDNKIHQAIARNEELERGMMRQANILNQQQTRRRNMIEQFSLNDQRRVRGLDDGRLGINSNQRQTRLDPRNNTDIDSFENQNHVMERPPGDNGSSRRMLEIPPNQRPGKKSLTHFRGKTDEDVEGWIFVMERWFGKNYIHVDDQIDIAVDFLKDGALATYRAARELNHTNEITWQELKEVLLREKKPYDAIAINQEKLRRLRQTKSVGEYINEFNSLSYKVKLSETEKVRIFVDGLKDRSHIAYEQPKSLLEAKTLAQKRETFFNEEHKLKQESRFSFNHTKNNYRDNRERRSYSPYQNNNNQGRRQFSRPNQYQSKNQAAPITEDRKAKIENKSAEITCYTCGEKGHKSPDCNKRQPNKNTQNMDKPNQRGEIKERNQKHANMAQQYNDNEDTKVENTFKYRPFNMALPEKLKKNLFYHSFIKLIYCYRSRIININFLKCLF